MLILRTSSLLVASVAESCLRLLMLTALHTGFHMSLRRELSVDTTPVPGNPLATSPSQPTTPAQSTAWHPTHVQQGTQSRCCCVC